MAAVVHQLSESDAVWQNKHDRAVAAGLSDIQATVFAADNGDISLLERLIAQGCSAENALRIAT